MIKGDAGMESIYTWSEHTKRESFRGVARCVEINCNALHAIDAMLAP
jgi:hypothetical protein